MKIYTCNYATYRQLKDPTIVPIQISVSKPSNISCFQIVSLYPEYNYVQAYKQGNLTEEAFTKLYKEKLRKVNPFWLVKHINYIVSQSGVPLNKAKVFLLCHEPNGQFCHRHILSEWLNNLGQSLKEYEINKEDISLESLFDDISSWASKTFPDQTGLSKSCHLEKEATELRESLDLIEISKSKGKTVPGQIDNFKEEAADVLILLLNIVKVEGYSVEDLLSWASHKLQINKSREWNKPDKNGVYLHKK